MTITLTWQSIITAGAVLTALGILAKNFTKTVNWFNRQEEQDKELQELKHTHEEDVEKLRADQEQALADIMHEQTLLTYGVLACLKGLQEQGCNGPVTEAVNKIEKYLNKKAHHEGGLTL